MQNTKDTARGSLPAVKRGLLAFSRFVYMVGIQSIRILKRFSRRCVRFLRPLFRFLKRLYRATLGKQIEKIRRLPKGAKEQGVEDVKGYQVKGEQQLCRLLPGGKTSGTRLRQPQPPPLIKAVSVRKPEALLSPSIVESVPPQEACRRPHFAGHPRMVFPKALVSPGDPRHPAGQEAVHLPFYIFLSRMLLHPSYPFPSFSCLPHFV